MKKTWILAALLLTLILGACGNDGDKSNDSENEQTTNPKESEQQPDQNQVEDETDEESEKENKDEPTINDDEDKETGSAVNVGENLLTEDQKYEFEDGDVTMIINQIEFTNEFTTTSGDENRDNSVDSEILIHIKGVINNDTTNGFSFSNPLAPVKAKILYDDKHEFELTGASESPDGKTFEASSILPLQEQVFHLYKNVPLPVSETDKSLVLVITHPDGEEKIELR